MVVRHSARAEHPLDLPHRRLERDDVLEDLVADHDVESVVVEGQPATLLVVAQYALAPELARLDVRGGGARPRMSTPYASYPAVRSISTTVPDPQP